MRNLRRRVAEFDALLLTAGIWFLAKFIRYAFPPLFPTFQTEFRVSNALLGTAFTAMMLAYAAMQFPAGAIADRVGSVRVIGVGGGLAVLASFLLALETPLPVVILGMVLVGFGTGVHKPVAVRLLSGVYPERTGRTLGVMDTFGTFGGVVAPAAVVAVSTGVGWRAVFLSGGILGAVLVVGFLWRVSDPGTHEASEDSFDAVRYLHLFADRRLATFVVATVAFSFAYNGAVAFLPLFLVDAAETSEAFANGLYGLLFAVSVVQPVSGDLSDRFGPIRVLVGMLALATVGLGSLLIAGTSFALGAAVVAFGVGSHGYRPVRAAYLVEALPEEATGGGVGVVRTILMAAGAVSPAVVGYLSEAAGFRVAFGLLVVSVGVSLGAVLVLGLAFDGRPS